MSAALLVFAVSALAEPAAAPRTASNGFDEATIRDAIAAIPLDRLDAQSRAKLNAVISQPTIYRRLPVSVVESDPDLYLFLVRYPEVVVNMWQLMGVTKVKVTRTSDFTLDAVDGAGTTGRVELVYGDRDTHVYYSEGSYEGPLFGRLIKGRCVLVLKSEYYRTMDQRVYITNRLDMFVHLENIGAEILAKTLQPLVGKTADQNFIETSRFVSQVSVAAETKPDKLQTVTTRLTNVDPKVRAQLVALIQQVSNRSVEAANTHFTGVENAAETAIPPSTSIPEATESPASGELLPPSPEPSSHGLRLRRG